MDNTLIRRLPGRVTRLSIVVAASLLMPACSTLPDMFGSEPKSSTGMSEVMAEGSRAVGAAASEVAVSLGLTSASGAAVPVEKPSAEQPPAPKAVATKAPRPRVRTQSKVTAAAQPTAPIESVQPNAEPVVTVSNEADNVIETATSPIASPLVVVDARSPIYSKDDRDVIPAKLMTTQEAGPLFRGARPEMNTMELVVSRQGRVEQVRLLTPVKRMTDMLLLSGAKTWKFTPALKEGQPVRYRTMFSWEATP